MGLLNQIFAIIFYTLFFSWITLKIINVVLIEKKNYKEIYKNIKKDLKHQKLSIYLSRIILMCIFIFVEYFVIGLAAGALALFMIIFTLGGAAYVDAGGDSTFYDNLVNFVGNYFSIIQYMVYYIYLIVYTLLIRAIYINILSYKKLKNDNILSM